MKRILILGSFGTAVGAAMATLGLNIGLAFSNPVSLSTSLFPSFLNTLRVMPLAGAMVGAVMAWLAVRWRNPLAQAGLGAGLALIIILLAGWFPFDFWSDAPAVVLAVMVLGASIGVAAGLGSHLVLPLSDADLRHALRGAGFSALLTPIATVLVVLALTLLGLGLASLFAPPPDPLLFESYPPGLGVMLFGILAGFIGVALALPTGALAGALIAGRGAQNRWAQMLLGIGVGLNIGPVVSLVVAYTPLGLGGLPRVFWPIVAALVGGLAGLIAGRLTPSNEAGVPLRVSPSVITASVCFTIAQTIFWLGPPLGALREFVRVLTPTSTPLASAFTATPALAPFRLSEMAVIEPGNAARLELVAQLRQGRNGGVWSPDGELLLLTDGSEIVLYDALTLNPIRSIPTNGAELSSLALAPDGQTIAAGDSTGAVQVWEIGGKPLRVLTHHSRWVTAVAFSPDGRWLASASFDHSVTVSDVAGGNEHRFSVPGQNEPALAFSPDNGLLATLGDDGALTFWDTTSWTEVRALNIGHPGRRLSFSPDGGLLAIGSNDDTVALWDILNWVEIQTLTGHTGGVWALDFSPDGRLLASGSADHTVRVWDVTNGTELIVLSGHMSDVVRVTFSRDGRALISIESVVVVWGVR